MIDDLAAGMTPRPWLRPLVVAFCLLWLIGLAVRASASPLDRAAALDLTIASMPPLIAAAFVAGLRRPRQDEVDPHDERLEVMQAALTTARGSLESLEQSLVACLGQARLLAHVASDSDGLAASAERLVAAAGDVARSGAEADRVTTQLAATLPEVERLNQEIAAVGNRVGGEATDQLKLIEALLVAVQVRGDEVSAQADAAIVSLNTQLAEVDEKSRQTTSQIAKRAYALDAAVDGASARAAGLLDSVGASIAARMAAMDDRLVATRAELDAVGEQGTAVVAARLDRLFAAGERLTELFAAFDAHTAGVRDAIEAHLDALPGRLTSVRATSDAAFDNLSDRVAALHGGLANLDQPLASATSVVGGLDEHLGRLQHVTDHFQATLAAGLPTATSLLDALEHRSGSLTVEVTAIGQALGRGNAAATDLAALVDRTRTEVAALGEADLRLVDDRMNATAIVMRDIGRQITGYGVLSSQTNAAIESELDHLERRFLAAGNDGEGRLATLGDQITTVRMSIEELAEPIAVARTRLGDIDAQVGHIGTSANDLAGTLDASLDAARLAFTAMHERAAALIAESAALQSATIGGTAAIVAASDRFGHERANFADAAAAIGTAFDRARDALVALDAATADVTAGTAEALGQTYIRARKLAEANTAALQVMLADVIQQAEDALGRAGAEAAETAFAAPIRRHLTALGDAATEARDLAETAAQRVAGQVRSVGQLIAGVDAKIGELETRLDVRARDTLSARSSRLIAMLATASVDVSRLMAFEADQRAWVRFAKGDRSIFARHAVRLIDRPTAAKISRHFDNDTEFRDEASHYLDLFEQLSHRLASDPDGDALLATVVSSDLGKLYVAIARATGRWSPVA